MINLDKAIPGDRFEARDGEVWTYEETDGKRHYLVDRHQTKCWFYPTGKFGDGIQPRSRFDLLRPLDAPAPAEPEQGDAGLERRLGEVLEILREHHKWHLDGGDIGLPDGEGGWVEINLGAEYSDSSLCTNTEAALTGMPPEDPQPMPRGGISAWWWGVGVLERRKRRAAEKENAALLLRATKAEAAMDEAAKAIAPFAAMADAIDANHISISLPMRSYEAPLRAARDWRSKNGGGDV